MISWRTPNTIRLILNTINFQLCNYGTLNLDINPTHRPEIPCSAILLVGRHGLEQKQEHPAET